MNEGEDWDHEYPEGSFGWKINNKVDAIGAKPSKSCAVLMHLLTLCFLCTLSLKSCFIRIAPLSCSALEKIRTI